MVNEDEHKLLESTVLIDEVREKFLGKGADLTGFDERDVDRIRRDDLYVWLFLRHKQRDVDKAQEMIIDCLRWRESFGINDIKERSLNRRLFEIGFLFPHNTSISGNTIVIFRTRLFRKDSHNPVEVKRFVAFGLEKLARQNPGQKVLLLFDMQESGLANMDMELIKFVITCFQTHFPSMLEYLIVLEMPWILSAAWKIVKGWLSTEGISKIKFVNKTEILQYIGVDQLLTSMGGTDKFEYKYPPQPFDSKPSTDLESSVTNSSVFATPMSKKDLEFNSISVSMSVDANGKDNAFEKYEILKRNGEETASSIELSLTDSVQKKSKGDEKDRVNSFSSNRSSSRKRDQRGAKKSQLEYIGPLVTICPAEELIFCGSDTSSGEILQILTLTNTTSSMVAFKVKTTSPENFRVRPSSGPIASNSSAEINILLQPGHANNLRNDKFLVLSAVVPDKDKVTGDLSNMWKTISKSNIMEHRLRCRFESSSSPVPYSETYDTKTPRKDVKLDPMQQLDKDIRTLEEKVNELHLVINRLSRDLRGLLAILLVILLITAAFGSYFLAHFTKDRLFPLLW